MTQLEAFGGILCVNRSLALETRGPPRHFLRNEDQQHFVFLTHPAQMLSQFFKNTGSLFLLDGTSLLSRCDGQSFPVMFYPPKAAHGHGFQTHLSPMMPINRNSCYCRVLGVLPASDTATQVRRAHRITAGEGIKRVCHRPHLGVVITEGDGPRRPGLGSPYPEKGSHSIPTSPLASGTMRGSPALFRGRVWFASPRGRLSHC